jgi:hypothetical protein
MLIINEDSFDSHSYSYKCLSIVKDFIPSAYAISDKSRYLFQSYTGHVATLTAFTLVGESRMLSSRTDLLISLKKL